MRATHDALLTGIGTVLADDPEFTCRLNGMSSRSPIRVVLDSKLRTPLDGKLIASAAKYPVWIVTAGEANKKRAKALLKAGAKIVEVSADAEGRPDVVSASRALAERGITRVLAECGPELSASLLKAGLVDRLEWFRAGKVVGGDGYSAVAALGVDALTETVMLNRTGGQAHRRRYAGNIPRSPLLRTLCLQGSLPMSAKLALLSSAAMPASTSLRITILRL